MSNAEPAYKTKLGPCVGLVGKLAVSDFVAAGNGRFHRRVSDASAEVGTI
jgi:hypothetical protein